jgi:HK97 family phage major capsid protein
MKLADQIKALLRQRKALLDELTSLTDKAVEGEGDAAAPRLFTVDEQKAFDKTKGDIADIDAQVDRLKAAEETQARTAAPARNPLIPTDDVEVRAFKPFPGQALARFAMALAVSKGNIFVAQEIAKRWDNETPEVGRVLRAAVAAGTTTDPAWAGPLVYYQNLISEFIEFLRPLTVLGQLTGYRTVPFNVRIPRQTAGSTAQWVGEGLSKPVSALAFDAVTFPFAKVAVIIVITQELARFSSPSAEVLVRDDMGNAIAAALDTTFLSTAAPVAGVKPGGIGNGAATVPSSGNTLAQVTADLAAAMLHITEANIPLRNPVWIMGPQARMFIATLRDAMGNFAFPTMMNKPFSLFGIPVIETTYIVGSGGPPTLSTITLLEQSELMVADDGQVMFDASQEASLQMDSAPATPPTPLVSLWQQNLLGLKAERFMYWQMRRPQAVVEITGFPAGGSGLPLVAGPGGVGGRDGGRDGGGAHIMGTENYTEAQRHERERLEREQREARERETHRGGNNRRT